MTTSDPYTAPTAHPGHPASTAPAEPRPLSITSLVVGLASIVFGWTLLAPVAGIVIGALALSREPAGRAFAIWGIVLNAVMLAGVLIGMLIGLVGLGVGFAFLPFAFL
jgi:hypothetical protein